MADVILGIAGPPRCGKTTFCSYLASEYRAQRFYAIAGVKDQLVQDLGREPERGEIDQRVAELRAGRPNFSVVAETMSLALASPAPVVIIDSLKFLDDLYALKAYPNTFLVAIEASEEVRDLNRARGTDKPGERVISSAEARAFEAASCTESEMPRLLAHADFRLVNLGDERFLRAIDSLMSRIHVQHTPFLPVVSDREVNAARAFVSQS